MPPRHLAVAIIAFWLAATGSLFYRDLWPRLRPGGPPPFAIDLADEASDQSTRWTIYIDGQDRGSARTRVEYRRTDDTFELSGEYRLWTGPRHLPAPDQFIVSSYRVNRDGQLLAMRAEIEMTMFGLQIEANVDSQVVAGRLTTKVQVLMHGLTADAAPLLEQTLPPVDLPYRASVLNPQQPFNKIRGLSPGQRWRMPYFDPVRVIGEQTMPGLSRGNNDSAYLDAEVGPVQPLPDLQLRMGPNLPSFLPGGARCLLIEYHGDDLQARTWVRESDSVVVRQEATKNGQTIILQRD